MPSDSNSTENVPSSEIAAEEFDEPDSSPSSSVTVPAVDPSSPLLFFFDIFKAAMTTARTIITITRTIIIVFILFLLSFSAENRESIGIG